MNYQFQLSPQEIEFFAMNHLIQITPNFNEQAIQLTEETYGPFRVDSPVQVPLWLAVFLVKKGKCHIQVPDEFSQEILEL